MAAKNTLVTTLAIIMFYSLQNASFMHISPPINGIDLCHFGACCKIKMASKIADSRFIMEMPYFSRFALFFFFCIFEGSDRQDGGE